MGSLTYRFTIIDPAQNSGGNLFTPGMATVPAVHWSVNSKRGDPKAYIESPPTGDGQEVDLITGRVTDGSYTVRVLDLLGTTGGTSGTGDELNDPAAAIYSRWAINYTGAVQLGGFGAGFIQSPYAGTSDAGINAGGTVGVLPILTGGEETWVSRTFTGLQPNTSYTVTVRYYNRGCASLLAYGLGQPASGLQPFLRTSDGQALGMPGNPPLYTATNPTPEYLTLTGMSDGSGNLFVDIGVHAPVGCVIFSWVVGFDWVRITEGTPATTGRYSTIALADSSARQQVLGRPAYIETSSDEGTTWDRVLHSGYVTAIRQPLSLVHEYDVGDTRRVERVTQAFKSVSALFPNGTPLIGGPSRDGWDPHLPNVGLPTFVITEVSSSLYADGAITQQGEIVLTYESGPMPEAYNGAGDNFTRSNFDVVNERARKYWVADATVPTRTGPNGQRMSQGAFPRLRVQIEDTYGHWQQNPGETVAETFVPWSWEFSRNNVFRRIIRQALQMRPPQDALFGEGGRIRIPWDAPAVVMTPLLNGRVHLRMYPLDVSEEAPLHIAMHPVAIVANLYSEAGVPYNAASVASVTNALGTQLDTRIRITKPQSIQSFIETLFGTYDFATRVENGERVFFTLRRKAYVSPSVTVDDSTLREEGGPTFDLNESTKINQVRYKQDRYAISPEDNPLARAWDDIEATPIEVQADLVDSWPTRSGNLPLGYQRDAMEPTLDSATFGEREQGYQIEGQPWIQGIGELPAKAYARGLAERVFDRAGRGMQATTLVCRAGAGVDDVRIGDEIGVDISHHPNAQFQRTPSSQRGGSRVATVIRREEAPEGPTLTVIDAGTGTQPFDIAPLAGRWSADVDPLNNSVVLLDLAPTTTYSGGDLGSACVLHNGRVIVKIAFSGAEPTTDEGIEYTIIDPAEHVLTPSTPGGFYDISKIPLGPFPTTQGLWVRLQTFVPGATPSAPSDWMNVTVGAPPGMGSISGLTVSGTTDSTISLTWTNTDTVQTLRVSFRETAIGGSYFLAAILPATSDRYTITGLTANTQYDLTVALADGTTIATSGTTTNSGLSTLPTPQNPIATSDGAGTFGLRVLATQVPATVSFHVATETGVGSGLAGSYSEYGRVPAVLGQYLSADSFAANDGRLRYVRAKLSWPGYTDSAYTAALPVDPWSTGALPVPAPGPGPIIVPPGGSPPTIPPGSGPGQPTSPIGTYYISQIAALGLASDDDAFGTVWVGKGSICFRVTGNGPCRLRLYDLSAERTADLARAIDSESDSDDCVLDVVLHASQTLDLRLKPRATLGSAELPPISTLYYTLHNYNGEAADLLVELHLQVHAP